MTVMGWRGAHLLARHCEEAEGRRGNPVRRWAGAGRACKTTVTDGKRRLDRHGLRPRDDGVMSDAVATVNIVAASVRPNRVNMNSM